MKVYKESDCVSLPGGGEGSIPGIKSFNFFFQQASTVLLTLLFSTLILPLDRYKN